MNDIEGMTGYGFIRKDRAETESESRRGDVAIVYKKSSIEMRKIKVDSNFEIVAAIGRRTGQRRKIVTIGNYITPTADAEELKMFLEAISKI